MPAALTTVSVFSQGLQENVEGWDEEENLVSDAPHLLLQFICPFSLFLENTLSLTLFSLTHTHTISLTHSGQILGLVRRGGP